MGAKYPALDWADLGPPIQADLRLKGLDGAWFSSKGKSDDLRRTVLNIYVKMAGITIGGKRLWDFVGRQFDVTVGRLEFIAAPGAKDFMNALASATRKFTNPGTNIADTWDSREFVAFMQLHLKHFKGWPDPNRVEAHIDPHGLYSGPGLGRANVVEMLVHACTMNQYQNVANIQEGLIKHNWGKTILLK